MTTKQQRLFPVLASLLLSLVGAIVALEVGLRHFYQLIPLDVCAADNILAAYYCQPYFVYDKPIRIGYRYEPNMHIETWWNPADPHFAAAADATAPSDRNDSFWYVFETDEMGFPNNESKWRDQYDIIVTGDSFVTRFSPQTWIELLGAQTGRSILTLGASSWSTLNEAEAVKLYGLDKDPSWVILLYFEGNDLLNTMQYMERRDSGLDWREYDMQDVAWYRRLVMYHMAQYWLGATKMEEVVETDSHAYRYPITYSTEQGDIPTVLKDIHLLPMSADYDTLARSDDFAHTSNALLELRDLVEAQGARLLVVFVPSKEHIVWSRVWGTKDVNNILEHTVTVTLSEGEHGALVWKPRYLDYNTFTTNHNAQERLFVDFAQANDIELLNLTPDFWEKTIEEGELYNYADPHWNQVGNQLAADLIANYITMAGE
jgi:hypothetical protein